MTQRQAQALREYIDAAIQHALGQHEEQQHSGSTPLVERKAADAAWLKVLVELNRIEEDYR